MEFSEIVAITGMPGLYKSVAKRQDGMIVSVLGDDKSKFVSSRIHMFTPLENITIYTNEDSVTLKEVFRKMKEKDDEIPPPDPSSSNEVLKEYFVKVLPDYDQEKVYTSDIKKVIKWHNIISGQGLLTDELLSEKEEEKENEKQEEENGDETGKTPSEKNATANADSK